MHPSIQGAAVALLLSGLLAWPLTAMGWALGEPMALFSLDFLGLALLTFWTGLGAWALLLLLPFLVLDFLAYGPTGVTLLDLLSEGLDSAQTLPVMWQWLGPLVLLLLGAGWLWAARRSRTRRPGWWLMLMVLCVALAWLGKHGAGVRVFRSGLAQVTRMAWAEPSLLLARMNLLPSHAEPVAHWSLPARLMPAQEDNVVILVESLGLPVQQEQAWLQAQLQTLLAGRRCQGSGQARALAGVRDAGYFTVEAEFRELCSLRTASFRPDFDGAQCWPHQAVSATAYHNNHGRFYNRSRLYPRMGFQQLVTRDTLALPGSKHVPFGGIPDQAMAQELVARARVQHGLHYWMTLDLHSPYPASRLQGVATDVSGSLAVYQALQQQQMQMYRDMVAALPNHNFLLVGDHPPKFFDASDQAFQKRRVPYFWIERCGGR